MSRRPEHDVCALWEEAHWSEHVREKQRGQVYFAFEDEQIEQGVDLEDSDMTEGNNNHSYTPHLHGNIAPFSR